MEIPSTVPESWGCFLDVRKALCPRNQVEEIRWYISKSYTCLLLDVGHPPDHTTPIDSDNGLETGASHDSHFVCGDAVLWYRPVMFSSSILSLTVYPRNLLRSGGSGCVYLGVSPLSSCLMIAGTEYGVKH